MDLKKKKTTYIYCYGNNFDILNKWFGSNIFKYKIQIKRSSKNLFKKKHRDIIRIHISKVHESITKKFSKILKNIKPEILIITSKLTFDEFKIGIGKLHIDNMDYIISINGHSYNIYKGDKKFFLQEIKEVKKETIRIKNKLENDKNYNINKDDENKDSESEDDEYVDENEESEHEVIENKTSEERQRSLKRRRKVTNVETRVEVEITNMIETTLNYDSIQSVETEVPITTNKTNIQVNRRWIKRYELGRMDQTCAYCGAKFWMEEKDLSSNRRSPTFAICCAHGKVCLPPLLEFPSYLLNLYISSEPTANLFRKNIRKYNNILACTSFGANIDKFHRRGVSNFRIHGQVYHRIGSLLPEEGHAPAFAQLYIYDTAHENQNRCNIMQDLDEGILQNLQNMLDQHNPYIQNFRQVRDAIQTDPTIEVSLLIHGDRTKDSRRYNIPIASEVAAIMVGDGHEQCKLHCNSRAILTPKNDDVENISNLIMEQFPGELHIYPSADDVSLMEDRIPILLLRNLDLAQGLCNGTRLICRGLQSKVIDAEIITGTHIEKRVFIPR
ncbi:10471_t:CDS:2, partial [Gigaspora margarita]